jgi:hypothetical protein
VRPEQHARRFAAQMVKTPSRQPVRQLVQRHTEDRATGTERTRAETVSAAVGADLAHWYTPGPAPNGWTPPARRSASGFLAPTNRRINDVLYVAGLQIRGDARAPRWPPQLVEMDRLLLIEKTTGGKAFVSRTIIVL